MIYTFAVKPRSTHFDWLMSLRIKNGPKRYEIAFSKIAQLCASSSKGHVGDYCELFRWHQSIIQLTGCFEKEIKRFKNITQGLMRRRIRIPVSSNVFNCQINNPISIELYHLFKRFDELSGLLVFCMDARLLKRRRVMARKEERYIKQLIALLMKMGHFRVGDKQVITEADQKVLIEALGSDVMPIVQNEVLLRLRNELSGSV